MTKSEGKLGGLKTASSTARNIWSLGNKYSYPLLSRNCRMADLKNKKGMSTEHTDNTFYMPNGVIMQRSKSETWLRKWGCQLAAASPRRRTGGKR